MEEINLGRVVEDKGDKGIRVSKVYKVLQAKTAEMV